jgi:hypothetical protein
MKREWILLIVSTVLTLFIALTAIRWFAPNLMGGSPDLRIVKEDREVPPFFDNIFREEDYSSEEFILQDPRSIIRGKPLYTGSPEVGPNDILGFRNRSIPNAADIVTIGDSQTYGNNAFLDLNWPNRMRWHLRGGLPVVYNMSVGGWNAPQYLEIFSKATRFKPRVVVVAFYTGNDPLASFLHVYGSDNWPGLRMDENLTIEDAPPLPPAKSDHWTIRFRDGTKMRFTPRRRLISNNTDNPAAMTGYRILKEVVRRIGELSKESGTPVIFTIIPTKELVHEKRILQEEISLQKFYSKLVRDERRNILDLAAYIRSLEGLEYVDILTPLEKAAMSTQLYPSGRNGHPLAAGYNVIGRTVALAADRHITYPLTGLAVIKHRVDKETPVLIEDDGYWLFASEQYLTGNGWQLKSGARYIDDRDVSTMPLKGIISVNEPGKYGPEAFRHQQ